MTNSETGNEEAGPPPLPSTALQYATPAPPARDGYQTVADTLGFVPSKRKADNKLQSWIFVITFAVIFVATEIALAIVQTTLSFPQTLGVSAISAFAAALVAVIISGAVLAVVNLFRAGQR